MEIINGKYKLENTKLGSGGFSEVFLGTDITTNQQVAIKRVSLSQKSLQEEDTFKKLNTEIGLMQTLDHPNIVKYYDVVKTPTHWYIIMEYCNMGTLEDVIKFNESMSKKKLLKFNREANTYYYLNQLKDALNYLRKKGCIHRDIKPMNILLTKNITSDSSLVDSGTIFKSDEQIASLDKSKLDQDEKIVVKLADFGLAKSYMETEESLMNTICGSPLYMAPELILNKEYNSKADLWSFGVIMYQLLYGIHPQSASSFPQLVRNLKTQSIDFKLNKNFTPHCFDLVSKLLIKDPRKRLNWVELFNHKWFLYWKNINNGEEDTFFIRKIPPDLTNTRNGTKFNDPEYKNEIKEGLKPIKRTVSNGLTNITNTSTMSFSRGLNISTNAKPATEPIKITNARSLDRRNDFPENSPKFSTQIGSPNSPNSPLGYSNLSRMKIENFFPRSYTQGSYSDYPSSYPPSDPKATHSRSLVTSINKPKAFDTKPMQIAASNTSTGNSSSYGFSQSFGTPPSMTKLSTSRNRIFMGFTPIKKNNESVDGTDKIISSKSDMDLSLSSSTGLITENSMEQQKINSQSTNTLDMSEYVIVDYDIDQSIKKTKPTSVTNATAETISATSFSASPVTYVDV
ncbi:putative serine threonine-protein kinase [Tupanvirus soda lake]|uniref:Serine threonine-protein kinase n=2 Tax=Tupanvirus TaxID=2094720 RepID=A0AC62AB30_9VIRU|nr:putative serine threonine-protein kinase [Tupanvirus soda lake]QKU34990.1 putative serine threonine-protein kinase [Tupanvirus soda lake]